MDPIPIDLIDSDSEKETFDKLPLELVSHLYESGDPVEILPMDIYPECELLIYQPYTNTVPDAPLLQEDEICGVSDEL